MKRYLVVAEVAEILRCSERTVQGLVAEGRLPHKRIAGMRRILFEPDELEAALDGCPLERVSLPDGSRIVRPVSEEAA